MHCTLFKAVRLFGRAILASTTGVVLMSVIASGAPAKNDHVPDRLLVQHRIGTSAEAAKKTVEAHGAKVERQIEKLRISVLKVSEKNADSVAKRLESTGQFSFIERDFVATGSAVPNDPSASSQWHLQMIQAPAAWDITKGAATIPIAVIDSGVEPNHPDLAAKLIPGWNFLTGNSDTHDLLGHGTAVAGAAAAATDNGLGISGVGWANPVMPLVVLNSSNYATYSDIANAIIYAADRGVRIINVSVSGTSASSTLQNAVNYAWNKGAIVFAAAGNNANSTPTYPAACQNVVSVAATDTNDLLASFSSYGSWIVLSAPGNYIYSTAMGGSYGTWYGTSFASPIAAGVAALVLSARPGLTAPVLVDLLQSNADDLGPVGKDSTYGSGRVNAYRAVFAASSISADAAAPTVQITNPAAGATLGGVVAIRGTAADNVGVSKTELLIDGSL
ncbi:MAG TPA: S8 family serine peptidase, partial [Bryobacteraceae bacterium]|nr:S8 family serine peptidase [Bryobacteraceae bacterium]